MKTVNYLDVSRNLNNSNYKPYHKPNNEILYIQKDSNHVPSILKKIPTSIEKRVFTDHPTNHIYQINRKIPKSFRNIRLSASFDVSSFKRKWQQQQTK